MKEMRVILIRHGMTVGNRMSRYIGSTDEPLSPEGVSQAQQVYCRVSSCRVYVSPMERARQTAGILFPNLEQIAVEDFREMDFGAFENRTAAEMEKEPEYRKWVDGWCTGACPGGESRSEFSGRVCNAFSSLIGALYKEGAEECVIVAHGGTIMSILERFAVPKKNYFDYWIANCGICRCRTSYSAEGQLVLEGLEYPEEIA